MIRPVSRPVVLVWTVADAQTVQTIKLDARRAARLIWVALKFSAAPLFRRLLRRPPTDPPYPVRVRLALEELGLTFVKLGQFLAMRFDILPVDLCQELSRLFESVPPLDVARVKGVIHSELGAPVSTLFARFSERPLAAASVAQVHEAQTHRGERVAVKVQRPGIAAIFEADMRNLRRAAALLDRFEAYATVPLKDVADEFATYTRRELDFRLEGATADRVRRRMSTFAVVPKVFWDLSSSKVLTMEFLEGLSIARLSERLREGGMAAARQELPNFDLDRTLHNFTFAALHQLFRTGVFHADPHPGNILIRDDNRVAFVDFGIFGRLSNRTRETLAAYIENIAAGNIDAAYLHYSALSMPSAETDVTSFQRETKRVLAAWYNASRRPDTPLHGRHLGVIVGDMLAILHRHRLRSTIDTLLFWRAVIALDSSALSLSEQFDLLGEMRAFFAQHRPGVARRALDIVVDGEWQHRVLQVATTATGHAARHFYDAVHHRLRWVPSSSEARRTRARRNAHTRALGLAVASTATFIAVSTVQSAGPMVWVAVIGAAGLAQVWASRRGERT